MKQHFLQVVFSFFFCCSLAAQSPCDSIIQLDCAGIHFAYPQNDNFLLANCEHGGFTDEFIIFKTTIDQNSNTGLSIYTSGYLSTMFFKPVSAGCDDTGWTCFNDHSYSDYNFSIDGINFLNEGEYFIAIGLQFPGEQVYYRFYKPDNDCDGIDDDCDGIIDNHGPVIYYSDTDGDGFAGKSESACSLPIGAFTVFTDCDETNPNIPTAEACNGIDDDCDWLVDEGFPTSVFYTDSDADGFGLPFTDSVYLAYACSAPPGFESNNQDCDDENMNVNPGLAEVCDNLDNNCNGIYNEGFSSISGFIDQDEDGFGSVPITLLCGSTPNISEYFYPLVAVDGDCNDSNSNMNPNEVEVCDNTDNNCNGELDEGFSPQIYWADQDGDGFGENYPIFACVPPNNSVSNGLDCDDYSTNINPDAPEICDNRDNNCNDLVDEGLPAEWGYPDHDNDGYGLSFNYSGLNHSNLEVVQVENYGLYCIGFEVIVALGGDCYDYSADYNPAQPENTCDNLDNDCDGLVDEDVDLPWVYQDYDGDGFGSNSDPIKFCYEAWDFSTVADNNLDCNDHNPAINPDATEICNGYDDDCNGIINEGFTNEFVYVDKDQDQYGSDQTILSCGGQTNIWNGSLVSADCDTENPNINPSSIEICDGKDNNCDGLIDEGFSPITYYYDGDQDGFGDAASNFSKTLCGGITNLYSTDYEFYSLYALDCDDRNFLIHPNMLEICDAHDNNCNGQLNEGFVSQIYYSDYDQDGFGSYDKYIDCDGGAPDFDFLIINSGDCDDSNPNINSGSIEICGDNFDNNCDGLMDNAPEAVLYYSDFDQDGYSFADIAWSLYVCPNETIPSYLYLASATGDCQPLNQEINPGMPEIVNGGIDDNCDGVIDIETSFLLYPDTDFDGFGAQNTTPIVSTSEVQTGYSLNQEDCNDENLFIHPAATEVCNTQDDDCNNLIDDGIECLGPSVWSAFPNPSSTTVTIILPTDVETIECTVTDDAGVIQFVTTVFASDPTIDISSLDIGIYSAFFSYQGAIFSIQLMKI